MIAARSSTPAHTPGLLPTSLHHVSRFLRWTCAVPLLQLGMFPDAVEVSESVALLQASGEAWGARRSIDFCGIWPRLEARRALASPTSGLPRRTPRHEGSQRARAMASVWLVVVFTQAIEHHIMQKKAVPAGAAAQTPPSARCQSPLRALALSHSLSRTCCASVTHSTTPRQYGPLTRRPFSCVPVAAAGANGGRARSATRPAREPPLRNCHCRVAPRRVSASAQSLPKGPCFCYGAAVPGSGENEGCARQGGFGSGPRQSGRSEQRRLPKRCSARPEQCAAPGLCIPLRGGDVRGGRRRQHPAHRLPDCHAHALAACGIH